MVPVLFRITFCFSTYSFYLGLLFKKKLYIYLAVLGLSCGMWVLVPRPGIKPTPPASGARSPCHWATREIPQSPPDRGAPALGTLVTKLKAPSSPLPGPPLLPIRMITSSVTPNECCLSNAMTQNKGIQA